MHKGIYIINQHRSAHTGNTCAGKTGRHNMVIYLFAFGLYINITDLNVRTADVGVYCARYRINHNRCPHAGCTSDGYSTGNRMNKCYLIRGINYCFITPQHTIGIGFNRVIDIVHVFNTDNTNCASSCTGYGCVFVCAVCFRFNIEFLKFCIYTGCFRFSSIFDDIIHRR